MLLWLTQWLASDFRAFSVFSYITFRAVLATMTALVIAIVLGPNVIARLTAMKIGQSVRSDGPQTHLSKQGTPTMGGALVLLSIAITTLLWADLSNRFVWVVLLVTLGFGAIGWVDDYRKVVGKNPKGMPAREKLMWQSLIGLIAATWLAFAVPAPSTTASGATRVAAAIFRRDAGFREMDRRIEMAGAEQLCENRRHDHVVGPARHAAHDRQHDLRVDPQVRHARARTPVAQRSSCITCAWVHWTPSFG